MPLEFTEYRFAPHKYGTMPQLTQGGEVTTQSVALGATSTPSIAFAAGTQCIVISKIDADARIAIGANPVASAATRFLKAGSEYAFAVEPGQKLAAIAG